MWKSRGQFSRLLLYLLFRTEAAAAPAVGAG